MVVSVDLLQLWIYFESRFMGLTDELEMGWETKNDSKYLGLNKYKSEVIMYHYRAEYSKTCWRKKSGIQI